VIGFWNFQKVGNVNMWVGDVGGDLIEREREFLCVGVYACVTVSKRAWRGRDLRGIYVWFGRVCWYRVDR
jgi:hypothetical protein